MDESPLFQLFTAFPHFSDEERQQKEAELDQFYSNEDAAIQIITVLLQSPDNNVIQFYGVSALKRWRYKMWNNISIEDKQQFIDQINLLDFVELNAFVSFLDFYYSLFSNFFPEEAISSKVAVIIETFDQQSDPNIIYRILKILSLYGKLYLRNGLRTDAFNAVLERINHFIDPQYITEPIGCKILSRCMKFVHKNMISISKNSQLIPQNIEFILPLCPIMTTFYQYFMETSEYFPELTKFIANSLSLATLFVTDKDFPIENEWINEIAHIAWECTRKCFYDIRMPNLAAQFLKFLTYTCKTVDYPLEIIPDISNFVQLTIDDINEFNEQPSLFVSYAYSTMDYENEYNLRTSALSFFYCFVKKYYPDHFIDILENLEWNEQNLLIASVLIKIAKEKNEKYPDAINTPLVIAFMKFLRKIDTTKADTYAICGFLNYTTKLIPFLPAESLQSISSAYQKYLSMNSEVYLLLFLRFLYSILKKYPEFDFAPYIDLIAENAFTKMSKYSLKILYELGKNNPTFLQSIAQYYSHFLRTVLETISQSHDSSANIYESIQLLNYILTAIYDNIDEEQFEIYWELLSTLLQSPYKDYLGNGLNMADTLSKYIPSQELLELLIQSFKINQNSQYFVQEYVQCFLNCISFVIESDFTQEICDLFLQEIDNDFDMMISLPSIVYLFIAFIKYDPNLNVDNIIPLVENFPQFSASDSYPPTSTLYEFTFSELLSYLIVYKDYEVADDSIIQRWINAISSCSFTSISDLSIQVEALNKSDNEERHPIFEELVSRISELSPETINYKSFGHYLSSLNALRSCLKDEDDEEEDENS